MYYLHSKSLNVKYFILYKHINTIVSLRNIYLFMYQSCIILYESNDNIVNNEQYL